MLGETRKGAEPWTARKAELGGQEEERRGICEVPVDRDRKVSLNRFVKEMVSLTRKGFHEGAMAPQGSMSLGAN